jgi:hypothetical protein
MKLIPALVIVSLLSPVVAVGQDKEPRPAPSPIGEKGPEAAGSKGLKLTITVSKYQGEKKVSSTPFVVSLADDNVWNRIRAGARVPVPQRPVGAGATAPASYSYEQVGLSIDSRAYSLPNGTFHVETNASDASIVPSDPAAAGALDAPVIRNISVASTTVMKDGQTTQLSSATDPITGLVMRVDVTLNVSK